MTNKAKNNYTSSVLLKFVFFRDRQKAKNLKKTDASFWGLGVFFGGGVGYSLFNNDYYFIALFRYKPLKPLNQLNETSPIMQEMLKDLF
ncbi:hypothetical protein KVM19_02610 [Helicobacter pylori]|nr:hypothetical protein KVM19_02610 [Helicobacter pylori]